MSSEDMQAARAVVKYQYLLVTKRWRRAMTRVKTLRAELEQLKRAMREFGYFEVKTKDGVPDDDSSDIAYDAWREDNVGRHVGWSDD